MVSVCVCVTWSYPVEYVPPRHMVVAMATGFGLDSLPVRGKVQYLNLLPMFAGGT